MDIQCYHISLTTSHLVVMYILLHCIHPTNPILNPPSNPPPPILHSTTAYPAPNQP